MKIWGITFLLSLAPFVTNATITFDTYLPTNKNSKTAVYVVLHGCKQGPNDILADTRFQELADNYNYAIVTPKQNVMMNWDRCWNWFFPGNQMKAVGSEITTIMNYIRKFKRKNNLLNSKTFAIGFSAGAAQTMNLMACYPYEFDGIAVHSGIAYQGATDAWQAQEVIVKGPAYSNIELVYRMKGCSPLNQWKEKTIVLFHGKEDQRVVPANFTSIKNQIMGRLDLQDDGKLNNSHVVKEEYSEEKPYRKHPYTYEFTELKGDNHIHSYLVENMAHDWSGGPVRIGRNDPKGPDATAIIIDLFF